MPVLGRGPLPGLFLATGHFRNGILLAPVTALAMADCLAGSSARDLSPFSVGRFPESSWRDSGKQPARIESVSRGGGRNRFRRGIRVRRSET
jgi:hypothetical protein